MKSLARWAAAIAVIFATGALADVPADPDDAVGLYVKAAGNGFAVQSPGESPLMYNDYPPYPPEWHRLAKAAREANADRLNLARRARSAAPGSWPRPADTRMLNRMRSLTEELADAGVYEHMQGNHAEAVEFERDVLALARSLRTAKGASAIEALVGVGVEAVAADRLMVIAPGLEFAKDKADRRNVSPDVVREVIKQLLTPRDVGAEVAAILAAEPPPQPGQPPLNTERLALQLNRSRAEQGMLAMSLACQLYRHRTGHWPETAGRLEPEYLPNLPADPFGSGRDSLGYVLIKRGLPDGGDRPLVYSRDNSKDGLFFRLDEPFYSFYRGDGSGRPMDRQEQGGEFRDVARWTPVKLPPEAPRTRKLAEPIS